MKDVAFGNCHLRGQLTTVLLGRLHVEYVLCKFPQFCLLRGVPCILDQYIGTWWLKVLYGSQVRFWDVVEYGFVPLSDPVFMVWV